MIKIFIRGILTALLFTLYISVVAQNAEYAKQQANDFFQAIRMNNALPLHDRFDSELKNGIPKDQLATIPQLLLEQLGTISHVDFINERDGHFVFLFHGAKRNLFLVLTFDRQQQWSQLLFTETNPYPAILPRPTFPSDNTLQSELDLFIDSVVQKIVINSNTPGFSIGITKNGERKFYNYGYRSMTDRALPNRETRYDIGSITKTFTALLAAQQLQAGTLSLETPVNLIVPESSGLQKDGKSIQLKHLLTHSSTLPTFAPLEVTVKSDLETNPEKFYHKVEAINFLKKFSLIDVPGDRFSYSNFGFGVVALMLEQKTKKTWDQMLITDILEPLKMKNTGLKPAVQNQTFGHLSDGSANAPIELDFYGPAGLIKSSTEDMLIFIEAQLGQQGSEAIKEAVKQTHQEQFSKGPHIGLSWFIEKDDTGTLTYLHGGTNPGYVSHCRFTPKEQLGIVVLANGFGPEAEKIAQELYGFLRSK